MSRAYRIFVRDTLRAVIRAEDRIETRLEILPILPVERMARLLAKQLEQQGYNCDEAPDQAVFTDGDLRVTVCLGSGEVRIELDSAEGVELTAEHERRVEDGGQREQAEQQLQEEVRERLQGEADARQRELQANVSSRLEAALGDVLADLDRGVNRATAEALKEKAAQLGQIKEVVEGEDDGSLTIVLEV